MDNNCVCFSFIMKLCTLCLCFFHGAAIVDWSDLDFSEEESDGLAVPNCLKQRVCNVEALQLSLGSGRYPEFLGIEGPQNPMDPRINSPLDYLLLLWPEFLSYLIVAETKSVGPHEEPTRETLQRGVPRA